MKTGVCELPDDPAAFRAAWDDLAARLADTPVDLLVLPEMAGVESFWQLPRFEPEAWRRALDQQAVLLDRLPQLAARRIVGTLVEDRDGTRLNRVFVHTRDGGLVRGRAKCWLPEEEGGWEATWFRRGPPQVPVDTVDGLRLATLVCTELMVSGAPVALGQAGVQALAAPRATGGHARWTVASRMAAINAGAYVFSANRNGGAFAGGSLVVGPDGDELARTSAALPLVVVDVDLAAADAAKSRYPRNVPEPVGPFFT